VNKKRGRTWLIGVGVLWAVPLLVLAGIYTLLALNGVRYDGMSGIPTWLNAVGYWVALVLLGAFWWVLWKSLNIAEGDDE
jgi:hypothetical protein